MTRRDTIELEKVLVNSLYYRKPKLQSCKKKPHESEGLTRSVVRGCLVPIEKAAANNSLIMHTVFCILCSKEFYSL